MPSASPSIFSSPQVDPQEKYPEGFEPIHAAVLRRLDRWNVDLYVLGKKNGPPVLMREAGLAVGGQQIDRLLDTVDCRVMVKTRDYQSLSRELLQNLDSIPGDAGLSEIDRFALIQAAAAAEIELAMSEASSDSLVKSSYRLGAFMVTLMENGKLVARDMFDVARHDHLTYSHVTNVCCYSLILAEALGVSDRNELSEIAVGALLHDIGKRHVPAEILGKPGALRPEEREVVRRHPQRGYEDLVTSRDLTLAQMLMAYQHHERVDGGGYPVGILGDEMHPWSKLLAVVDVFDALTGRRPYRPPMARQVALEYLLKNAGTLFDEEMVQCWNHVMSKT